MDNSQVKLILGDCVERMRELPMESVDAIVTDPPYGINFMGKAWDRKAIEEAVARPVPLGGVTRLTGSPESPNRKLIQRTGSAFANRAGEAGAYDFSPKGNHAFQQWCLNWGVEAFRTLKPGGHMLVFGGTRTYHRMAAGLEDAGFEIRDCLMWLYGQGFPKSLDVGKNVLPEERIVIGVGTNLKPAWEPVLLARKPVEGTVLDNVKSYGTGGLNIDASKIGGEDGRFPSNLMLTHHPDCVQTGTTMSPGRSMNRYTDGLKPFGGGVGHPHESTTLPDEEIEVWECVPGCPIGGIGDEARYFYQPKVSVLERNAGLDGFDLVAAGGMEGRNDGSMGSITYSRNHHPTVKPVDLMRYLTRLVTPPGGLVLDPFLGSGSTGIACALEGFDFVGIEQDAEYLKIAKHRIDYWQEHGEQALTVAASDRSRDKIKETGQLDVFDLLGLM